MRTLQIVVENNPAAADVAALGQGLTEHALPTTGVPGFRPLSVFFARHHVPYVNVEAGMDHLKQQIEMVRLVREMVEALGLVKAS